MGNNCNECRLSVISTEVRGECNQKYILHTVSERLIPKTFYKLDVDQPIMSEGKAIPLFIDVHEGALFAPTVRVSENEHRDCCDVECFDDIRDCGEKKRSRLIRVNKFGLGDAAFGSDLVCKRSCGKDCAKKNLFVYLNNVGEFTLVSKRGCGYGNDDDCGYGNVHGYVHGKNYDHGCGHGRY